MNTPRGPEWERMFDISYDLCHELDDVVKAKLGKLPPIWRSTALLYVIEHFAEKARFDVELPALSDLPSPDEVVG